MTFLYNVVEDIKSLSREEFSASWSTPVLLHRVQDTAEPRPFKTGVTDPRANRLELEAGLTTDPGLAVIRIVKRPDGPFKDRISIGRSRSCDIQVDYPKVSKLHAYFTWNESGSQFFLMDAKSTNGTFVNDHRLTSGQPVILPDRALIRFGRYHFRFHMPQGLHDVAGEIAFGR